MGQKEEKGGGVFHIYILLVYDQFVFCYFKINVLEIIYLNNKSYKLLGQWLFAKSTVCTLEIFWKYLTQTFAFCLSVTLNESPAMLRGLYASVFARNTTTMQFSFLIVGICHQFWEISLTMELKPLCQLSLI